MEKVQLEITGIEYSQTHSGSYVLHLKEIHGNRHMPIVIGSFEAQAIAVELESMVPNRPMTHDLFKPILLILDHINGNSDNCSLENLRLICSNCDTLTPTYKGRNKGNGRFIRRKKYAQGLSY